MFAISRDEMLAALQHMDAHNQKYYDAHCPKCRRANRVEGKRIELFFPDWKKTIKDMESEAAKAAAPVVKPVANTTAKTAGTASKKGPNKAGGKLTAGKKPAAKPAAKPKSTTPGKGGRKTSGGVGKK